MHRRGSIRVGAELTEGALIVRGKVSHTWLKRAQAVSVVADILMDFGEVRNRDQEVFDSMSALPVEFLPGQSKVGLGEFPNGMRIANQMKASLN